ncbi:hypothetical protein ZIOFF_014715 [Zingiber officinale]|uniref:Uncharacterized protein n=1 Tax=Zingiber officinale TaxID=94328 RepID=A0A8J5LVR6_ZINOF|nr:hypothetical protein ZIOFF_014715 [Zingiber officinale]
MVCMLGCGRMAAMARLLKVGSFQGMTAEEMTNEKLAAHTIHNEFQDANEANLLEEADFLSCFFFFYFIIVLEIILQIDHHFADMHVFDYRPLTDPLHLNEDNLRSTLDEEEASCKILQDYTSSYIIEVPASYNILLLVCCNACKKPIKASQYSTHADGGQPFSLKDVNVATVHCGLLNPIDDVLDIDGGISSFKKLPKKGKKIIQTTNGSLQMATAEQETPIHLDGNCGGGSTSKCGKHFAAFVLVCRHFLLVLSFWQLVPLVTGFKLQNKTMKRREVQASSSIKYHSGLLILLESALRFEYVKEVGTRFKSISPCRLTYRTYGDTLGISFSFRKVYVKDDKAEDKEVEPYEEG